ncbi:hypothetical protein HMPREF0080_00065 [Anaeroglobus geminatus F0357]|uniref:Uncharacterized protein n=1 Tax=Anaeroglobus geminatus F0357 TaxID=861450 RepID=G9YEK6_9FIRM|nr:hypothetical protein HMPREF0080_00065 [Anaeroglobus geminatus F0357]
MSRLFFRIFTFFRLYHKSFNSYTSNDYSLFYKKSAQVNYLCR